MRQTMARILTFAVVVVFAVAGGPVTAFATIAGAPLEVNVPGLIAIDRALDGSSVTFTGEAIGEDLRADADHRWVNVLGDGMAIGVYVTNEQAAQIERYGDHHNQGATVRVVGVVNIADDEHGGEFDVHAQEFIVLDPGSATDRPIAPWKAIVAAIAIVLALAETRLYGRMMERHAV